MTVSATTRKAGPYDGNDAATEFDFAFKVFAKGDIRVVFADENGTESDLVLDSDYSVALNADQDADPGGTVTYPIAGAPLATDTTLTIVGDLEYTQPLDVTNLGGFYPQVIENQLDRAHMLTLQLKELVSRSLQVAVSVPVGFDASLPAPDPYAVIGWNADGSGFQNTDPSGSGALAANLAASSGSSLVGFIQAGTGATARTAQAKLRDIVSVKDFGAVGDGSTDDTAAIQAALNAADSAQLKLHIPGTPNGYKITAPLTINSTGLSIEGDGAYVTQLIASGNFSEILKFNGSTLYASIAGVSFVAGATTTRCITVAQNATVIRLHQCLFSGGLNGDLLYSNGHNVDISESTFTLGSVNTWACNFDCYNQNCGVTDCRIGGTGNGIRITNAFSPADRTEGLRVANNYFINTGPYNISIGASLYTGITGNVLDQSSSFAVLIDTGAVGVNIDGNYIGTSGVGTAVGVQISATASTSHVISNNIIAYVAQGVNVVATGADRVSHITISDNNFLAISNNCIVLDSVLNATITGNVDGGTPTGGSWITKGTFGNGSYVFDNNRWHTAAPGLFHSASTYRFGNDTGIVGRNAGNNTSGGGATSLVVNHGLFTTPRVVLVTPETNVGSFFANTLTGAQFTVTWATAAAAKWHWQAEV